MRNKSFRLYCGVYPNLEKTAAAFFASYSHVDSRRRNLTFKFGPSHIA
jgi:hypothetical protein